MQISKGFKRISFVVLVVIVIALVLLASNLDPDKRDELFINAFSNLSGTIAGAILAFWFAIYQLSIQAKAEENQREAEENQRQIDKALDFHREWVTVEFVEARGETDKIFTEFKTEGNLNKFFLSLPVEKRSYILKVFAFFRRLDLEILHKRVDYELVKELFGGEFLGFYYRWFRHVIPDDWSTKASVERLNKWMKQELSKDQYECWMNEALRQRDELLSRTDSNTSG